MAKKKNYEGPIIQIRVRQSTMYHQQWAVPRFDRKGEKVLDKKSGKQKAYIVSEAVLKEDGTYVRKHQWICGCADWINRRQKMDSPYDRCKHIDAVIRKFVQPEKLVKGGEIFGRINDVILIPDHDFEGYQPRKVVNSGWSGKNLSYYHLIKIPEGAIPVNIEDHAGYSYCVGYLKGTTAYIAVNIRRKDEFDYRKFFSVIAARLYSPDESDLLLAMEEQRDRMAKIFGVEVTNEGFVFDGEFNKNDKDILDRLVRSKTLTDYRIVGPSLILQFDDKSITINKQKAWNGDYLVIVGRFSTFSVMGKNTRGSRRYNGANIHPHVAANGTPCLAGYNKMVVNAISKRNWINFTMIVSDFLTQYNPGSPYLKIA